MNLAQYKTDIDKHLSEIHSGDLTKTCPKAVLLGWLGKVDGKYPTALYRGTVAHAALAFLHSGEGWGLGDVREAVSLGADEVDKEINRNNCEKTDACREGREGVLQEIVRVLFAYSRRLCPMFEQCEVVGVETPVRLKFGEHAFASHTDLLVYDPDGVFGRGKGRSLVFDFKWEAESPTRAYLARNKQLMLYQLAASFGTWLFDVEWTDFRDTSWADVCFLHLPSLKPYQRKTVVGEIEYKKGDDRPIEKVLHWCDFQEHRAGEMIAHLTDHVRMLKAGYFPAAPTKIGCFTCPSQEFCFRPDYESSPHEL